MIIVVGGPAGCGKTTVGTQIANELDIPFIEGDSLHPPENIEKMKSGTPLTDDDRWGWLKSIAETAHEESEQTDEKLVVITCSSLKLKYRDYIRDHTDSEPVLFVFIELDEQELIRRVSHRQNHFMKADMVASQLHDMEPPQASEPNCIVYKNAVDVKDCVSQIENYIEHYRI